MRSERAKSHPSFAHAGIFPGIEIPTNFEPGEDDRRRVAKIFKEAVAAESKHGCLAPVGCSSTCGKPAIKSHTVGLSRELAAIADQQNKVRGAKLKMSAIFDFGNGNFEHVPIKRASAFPGFCKTHDQEIFQPIDEEVWTGSDKQVFLLAYRALCLELYAKFSASFYRTQTCASFSRK